MNLVIVESPAKAKTIEKYLGRDYKVLASKGHIVDLPKSNIGIDVENNFEPDYVVTNQKSLTALKNAAKGSDTILIAVDSDREGEAIGWHVAQKLGLIDKSGKPKRNAKPLHRITFTEITKDALLNALENKHDINIALVNAQQARRVLDRLVGYKLSPLLWQKIRYGLSAGRVQSVALRLIVDREEERNKFVPEEYWNLSALLGQDRRSEKKNINIFTKESEIAFNPTDSNNLLFRLVKVNGSNPDLKEQKTSKKVMEDIIDSDWVIKDISRQESLRNPKPPFITSTLQQTSANKLGFSAKQTMKLAQDLYEAGLITYMRTDSLNIADQAVKQIRTFVEKKFGQANLSENARTFKTKSKLSQEAHEAIRPSDVNVLAESIKFDEKHQRLYRLIWQRTLATQMKEARVESVKVSIEVKGYLFQLNGQRLLEKGYLEVYPEQFTEALIPELSVGQQLYLESLNAEQKFTEPIARFTEASLIKALESYGIARPSTYAPIISTITSRNYIEKDGRSLVPTDTGMVVIKLLKKHFGQIVDTNFTAQIENDLDSIAQGEKDWIKVLHEFYTPFDKNLEAKKLEIKKEDYTVISKSEEKCPDCGGKMVVKLGKFGKFHSCVDFPKCKGMKSFGDDTLLNMDQKSEEFTNLYLNAPKTDDDREYLLKRGRFGYFWAHPDYPKVKDAKPLEYSTSVFKELYGSAPKTKNGKKMVLRKGRFGEFWAHPDYPEKKEVFRINNKELKEKKKELGVE
ncbi:MAG TPA: type I DNA topoisomerase [Candidatus Dojkabacteria bacterium]|nr:type I DNA topoisomerase [Candidatus Dojkabacteria bacterium]